MQNAGIGDGAAASSSAKHDAKPDVQDKLELMHLIERLKLQKRTGWVRQGINLPESIADHMYRMAMLSLLSEEDDQLDIAKCVQMAVVHDLAEATVGDITPYDGISKAEKEKLESDAMQHITTKLLDPSKPASKRIQALYHEYEQRETREAKFVKDLDLLEMALQASEYEQAQGSDKMQPFFESSVPKIKHPEVKEWARQLMNERRSKQSQAPSYREVNVADPPQVEPVFATATTTAAIPPISAIKLSNGSVKVTDADDEIFDLYSALSASTPLGTASSQPSSSKGLGFVDAKSGILQIKIEVPKSVNKPSGSRKTHTPSNRRRSSSDATSAKESTSGKGKGKAKVTPDEMEEISVEIQQDLSGLRNRVGDTGSVVWRASVEFARNVLQQIYNPDPVPPLLDHSRLGSTAIIELGSGTGVLANLLSPYFSSWTCTDIEALLPTIRKNIKRNADSVAARQPKGHTPRAVEVLELDWTWTRKQLLREFGPNEAGYDIALAVDCLFNESLVEPFVNTLDCIGAKAVIVVSELRSPEVLRLFLETWLKREGWEIWRACKPVESETENNMPLLGKKYVVWVGWKTRVSEAES